MVILKMKGATYMIEAEMKGNYSIISAENVKQLEDLESKKDASIVDQSRIECSEVPQQLLSMVNKIDENVRVGSESEDGLEDNDVSSDVEAENKSGNSELANADVAAQEDQMSEKTDSEITTMAESNFENSEFENVDQVAEEQVSEKFDSELPTPVEKCYENSELENVDDGAQEDQVSEKLNSELTTPVENRSEKSELDNVDKGAQEDQVLVKLNSDLPTPVDQPPVLEKVAETGLENWQPIDSVIIGSGPVDHEDNTSRNDTASIYQSIEKFEASSYETSYAAPSSDVVSGEAAKRVLNEDLKDLKGSIVGLHPVTMLSDNLISDDSATGHINVEFVQEFESVKASDAKSGKLLLAMSMGKLKKALQQHSEKKRPALLARSENCPVIASP